MVRPTLSNCHIFCAMIKRLSSILLILCIYQDNAEAARILAVFPAPSISHQVVFSALTMELSNRGHELFIFTTDPLNNSSLVNYTEVDMHYTYDLKMNHINNSGKSWLKGWFATSEAVVNAFLAHPDMQRIIAPNSTENFDLILAEFLTFEATYALQNRLKIPMIGIVTLPLDPATHFMIGNPHALSYSPGVLDPYTDEMSFWQRIRNVYRNLRYIFFHRYDHLARQDKLVKKYFGNDMPHASDLGTETSLVLVNSNPALGYPRPNIPGVIEVGGFYLDIKMRGLEENLQNFLDSAEEGFIYFSLGSNAKSKHLPAEKINTLISVFASLPYKVLWKYEQDTLPGKPENVFISKWLPQHDVLAHPNIKAFIYQGGLQSTEEAVSLGVPLIGLPIFGDQEFNVRKIASVQAGARVNYETLSGDELRKAIIEVTTNKSYKENMLNLRKLYNDRPNDPMETAIWWIEYVIRHDGAPHLRPRVRHLAWYQRELLDVLGFVLLIALLLSYIIYKLSWILFVKYIKSILSVKIKTN